MHLRECFRTDRERERERERERQRETGSESEGGSERQRESYDEQNAAPESLEDIPNPETALDNTETLNLNETWVPRPWAAMGLHIHHQDSPAFMIGIGFHEGFPRVLWILHTVANTVASSLVQGWRTHTRAKQARLQRCRRESVH